MLAIATLLAAVVQLVSHRFDARSTARIGMAVAMVVAGVAHLVSPTPFLQHLPAWTPAAEALIVITGLIEIGLGVALVVVRGQWRPSVGLALAAYLIAVFPGNVYVAVAGIDVDGQPGGWYPWLRLPFQALFIAWALWSTRLRPPILRPVGAVGSRQGFRGDVERPTGVPR
ncbi:hypothetical protein E1193_11605 [Micromonospora sp. KC606]|uniref:DoxX family protein n=1 Tax=Micromonospora sp. KC606 TaxID=2530379 RepID=UPI00104AD893|nr:hypothetical protein [Micromonospora sp. KC606]TDC82488.1 hypothetical protein E1193_11605 [Micromonospora sp. KC606]